MCPALRFIEGADVGQRRDHLVARPDILIIPVESDDIVATSRLPIIAVSAKIVLNMMILKNDIIKKDERTRETTCIGNPFSSFASSIPSAHRCL